MYDIIVLPNWVVLVFGASRLNRSRRNLDTKCEVSFETVVRLLISHRKDETIVQKLVPR
jgi:hypothetical protein